MVKSITDHLPESGILEDKPARKREGHLRFDNGVPLEFGSNGDTKFTGNGATLNVLLATGGSVTIGGEGNIPQNTFTVNNFGDVIARGVFSYNGIAEYGKPLDTIYRKLEDSVHGFVVDEMIDVPANVDGYSIANSGRKDVWVEGNDASLLVQIDAVYSDSNTGDYYETNVLASVNRSMMGRPFLTILSHTSESSIGLAFDFIDVVLTNNDITYLVIGRDDKKPFKFRCSVTNAINFSKNLGTFSYSNHGSNYSTGITRLANNTTIDSVDGDIAERGRKLEDKYLQVDNYDTITTKSFRGSRNTGSNSTSYDIYRIAQAVGGTPASGIFTVKAQLSGNHSIVTFQATCAYGAQPRINILSASHYGSQAINNIYLEYNGTYDTYNVLISARGTYIGWEVSNVMSFSENYNFGFDSGLNRITMPLHPQVAMGTNAEIMEGTQRLSERYLGINSTSDNSQLLDGLDSTQFARSDVGDVIHGRYEHVYGNNGGYASTRGTGEFWGSNIWGIGPNFSGTASGSSYSLSSVYGLSWLRSGHNYSLPAVGEGMYLHLGGFMKAAIGANGIHSEGLGSFNGGLVINGKYVVSNDGLTIYENNQSLATKYLGINAKAVDSDKLDNLNSTQFLRSDVNDTSTGLLEMARNVHGGYGDSRGSGTNWGATVWSMGSGFAGNASGAGHTVGSYALEYLRGAHASTISAVGEGLYLYNNNSLRAAIGQSGIFTAGDVVSNGTIYASDMVTDRIRAHNGNGMEINVGESGDYANNNYTTNEALYVNSEAGLVINSSPDNWASGWAGRKQAHICNGQGNSIFPGTITATRFIGPATNAELLDNLDSSQFVRSDVNAFKRQGLTVEYGIHGGYGDHLGTGSGWGANIWSMGYSYDGTANGASFAPGANQYGLVWLRASNANASTNVGEGLYLYTGGALRCGMGTSGIYSAAVADLNGGIRVDGKVVASSDGNTLYENNIALSSKYLGISAKAVDADKLDGVDGSSFLRSDITDTMFGGLTTRYGTHGGYGDDLGTGTSWGANIWSMGYLYDGDANGPTHNPHIHGATSRYGISWIRGGTHSSGYIGEGLYVYRGGSLVGGFGNLGMFSNAVANLNGGVKVDGKNVISADGNTLYENNQTLASKYLGINAKAVDSNLLDGLDSTHFQRNDRGMIASPQGNWTRSASSATGMLEVVLPQSWTNTMISFVVDIFNYSTGRSMRIRVSGYTYQGTPAWHNPSAHLESGEWGDFTVRFGHNGSKCVVYIGEANTPWSHATAVVTNVTPTYTNTEHTKWATGWSTSFGATTAPNVTATRIARRQFDSGNIPTAAQVGALPAGSKAVDSDKLDGLDSTAFLRSNVDDHLVAKLETRYGIHGGYGNSQGTGTSWGSSIWSMGAAYMGNAGGNSFTPNANHFGIAWVRGGTHSNAKVGEGLYVYRGGALVGGIGLAGIYSSAVANLDGGVRVDGKIVVSSDGNTLYENNQTLAARYLGITAKASDADKLDGLNSTQFLRSDANTVKSAGHLTVNDNLVLGLGTGNVVKHFWNGTNYYTDIGEGGNWYIRDVNNSNATRFIVDVDTGNLTATGTITANTFTEGGVSLAARYLNIGAKAADSNLLDGLDSSQFLRSNGKAVDSDKLDGLDSTAFLRTNAKAVDSDKLDNLDSSQFLRSDTNDTMLGVLETRYGIHGGYGNSQGSGGNWGAPIWGMGTSYDGTGFGTSFVPTSMYGMAWIRGSHGSAHASIGEGVYVFQNGALQGGLGSAGLNAKNATIGGGLTLGHMASDLLFAATKGLVWGADTDSAGIEFNTSGDAGDNHLHFWTGDNDTEYFRWSTKAITTVTDQMHLRNTGLWVRAGITTDGLIKEQGVSLSSRYLRTDGATVKTMAGALKITGGITNIGATNDGAMLDIDYRANSDSTTGIRVKMDGDAGNPTNTTGDFFIDCWGNADGPSTTVADRKFSVDGQGNVSIAGSITVGGQPLTAEATSFGGMGVGQFMYRRDNVTDYKSTANVMSLQQFNNALPVGLSGAYNYGGLLTFNDGNSRLRLYAPHNEGSASALYISTGWDGDIRPWDRLLTKTYADGLYMAAGANAGTADNSQLLDGLDSAQFLRSDVNDSSTAHLAMVRGINGGHALESGSGAGWGGSIWSTGVGDAGPTAGTSYNPGANRNGLTWLREANPYRHSTINQGLYLHTAGTLQFAAGTGGVFTNGQILAVGNITAYYSDERLKDVHSELDTKTALSEVCSWSKVRYKANSLANQLAGYDTEKMEIGLLAGEVSKEYPELTPLAAFDNDGGVSKSGEDYKTLNYERVVAIQAAAIEELANENAELNKRLERLEDIILTMK
jgi:hypothetical protein